MSTRYPTTPMCDGTLLELFEPTVRGDDVFVSTTAKCGQTWLLRALALLRAPDAPQEFLTDTPWLENPLERLKGQSYETAAVLQRLAALESPRIFKLHLVWDEIPLRARTHAKLVTVTRDPRDVPFSMFSHLKGLREELLVGAPPLSSFDEYFEAWFSRGLYFDFVRSFWPHQHEQNVLWLRYEDMKQDLAAQLRRTIDFLGWRCDDAALQTILPRLDIAPMREAEQVRLESSPAQDRLFRDGANFFREGAVGKNRSQLSTEQEARIVQRARDEFEPDCFAFVMAQGLD